MDSLVMGKRNLKTERPYLSTEDRAFHSLFPLLLLPFGSQGCQMLDKKWLCFEDENDFQPNPVFNNFRILHCHPHFNNTHSGDTP
jgi:hypothetical protein